MAYWLPLVDTTFIVLSGVSLLVGYYFVKQRKYQHHKWSMLTATTFAALFLVTYLIKYFTLPTKIFAGSGAVRVVYLVILISHTILATIIIPFVLIVLYRALTKQFARHKQLARKTLPMWLYVAFTGWIIYMMLYHLTFSRA
jgi:putative membrane protein